MNSSFIHNYFYISAREESKDPLLPRITMSITEAFVRSFCNLYHPDVGSQFFSPKGHLDDCLAIENAKGWYGRERIRQDACRAHVSSHSPLG